MISTLYLYRKHFGISTIGQDSKTSYGIGIADAAIRAYCGRTFAITTYRKWHDGSGFPEMLIEDWPIIALYGVAVSGRETLTLSSSYDHAVATTTETSLVLIHYDTSGAQQTNTLTWAAYPTVTLLAAAVNLIAGWTATIPTGEGGNPTALIKPYMSGSCSENDDFDLYVPDTYIDARIDAQSNRTIIRGGNWRGSFDFAGGTSIFPCGRGNVFCWYQAGYTEPVDNADSSALATDGNVPADLTAICNMVAKAAIDSGGISAGGVQSETIGNYSYSLATFGGQIKSAVDAAIAANHQALTPYRRMP